LGGSFAPLGGQNLIEAAACGCPVLMGPHTFNFAQAAEMAVEAGAALRCADLAAAIAAADTLLHDPAALAQAQQRALAWSQAHRGATARTLAALSAYLM
jgi:3-deoxy-D-manno-octulosonic-acid transferase